MKDLLSRGPDGKFIGHGSALFSWLPRMLGSSYGETLSEMLEIAAKWCLSCAARSYRNAAKSTDEYDFDKIAVDFHTRTADRWIAKRDVLLETVKKLRELK